MRQWLLGSCRSPSSTRVNSSPIKAIAFFEGEQSDSIGESFGYPKLMTDDQFAEIQSRILQYSVSLSWHITGTISGDTFDETGSWTANTIPIVGFTEYTICESLDSLGILNGFGVAVHPYNYTRITNGVPAIISAQTGGIINLIASLNAVGADCTPYVFRTDLLRWLPRIAYTSSSDNGFLGFVDTAFDQTPAPGTHLETFTGTFNGFPMTVKCFIADGLSLSSANLVIEPILWWEYRTNAGADPIWDSATGAQLRNPATQQF